MGELNRGQQGCPSGACSEWLHSGEQDGGRGGLCEGEWPSFLCNPTLLFISGTGEAAEGGGQLLFVSGMRFSFPPSCGL